MTPVIVVRLALEEIYRRIWWGLTRHEDHGRQDPSVTGGGSKIFQGDLNSRGRRTKLLFCKNFAKNCMKMKEFGSRGGHVCLMLPGSATGCPRGNRYRTSSLVLLTNYVTDKLLWFRSSCTYWGDKYPPPPHDGWNRGVLATSCWMKWGYCPICWMKQNTPNPTCEMNHGTLPLLD